jgi:O-antigen/teichoic acid export membrane protein
VLRFGKDITIFNTIYFFSRSLDQIVIGRLWGAGPLGFYRQANQLVSAPISQLQFPVDHVAEPLLSALQEEPDRYRESYKKIISVLSFAMMPLVMYLIIYSEELVTLVLGDKWHASVPIFRMLAIAAFIQPVASTGGFVMVTCGKSGRYVSWGIMGAISIISAICVGAYWGPLGIATAYAVSNYVTLVPFLWFSFRGTPISIQLFFKAISIPAITSLLMGILLKAVSARIGELHNLVEIPLSFVLAFSCYLGIWLLFPGGKKKLAEYSSYLLVAFKSAPPESE